MIKRIESFRGKYSFLSNFYMLDKKIKIEGWSFPSVEHAFQAMKSTSVGIRADISNIFSPASAKKIGRNVELRSDWHQVKVHIMAELLLKKFKDPFLKDKLLKTEDAYLVEGNNWGDTFWGFCEKTKTGSNILGHLLMTTRTYYKSIETIIKEI